MLGYCVFELSENRVLLSVHIFLFCFGIYQKILNSGNRGFFHFILFGITRNSRHGIRACPGSLKTSKKLKEDLLLQQIIQQSENTVKVFFRLVFCVAAENS